MNKFKIKAYCCTLPLLVAGILPFFHLGRWGKWGCLFAALLAAVGFVALFMNYRSELEDRMLEQEEQSRNQIDDLKSKLESSEDFRRRYRETLKSMDAEIDALRNQLSLAQNKESTNQAEVFLSAYEKNCVLPFFSELRSVAMPLDGEDKQRIVDRVVDLAMQAIDMADSYDWDINNREEQKINCDRITGDITLEEALEKAVPITDNPMETPKWARALCASLTPIMSDSGKTVFSGYKMMNNEKQGD